MNQHSMDLSVTLKGPTQSLHLKNPVLTASGTFGYGMEFAPYGDLTSLGGIIVKGLSLLPRDGNPCPRIVETTAGMLNAVGLQNDGVEAFCKEKEHLVIPVIGTQRPAVVEDNGLSLFRTPVFVVNVDAVFRGYECHTADSSVKNNTTPKV